MTLPVVIVAAVVIAACGFAGGGQMPAGQSAAYVAGALALAGALVICGLFVLKSRWHGIGGAAVVAMAGCARNVEAIFAVLRRGIGGGAVPAGDGQRAVIAVICLVVFVVAARDLLNERHRRRATTPADHGP